MQLMYANWRNDKDGQWLGASVSCKARTSAWRLKVVEVFLHKSMWTTCRAGAILLCINV